MADTKAEMTAQLQCEQQGGPFKIVHVPKPALAPDEVLIRQRVIALNLIDVKQRDTGVLVPRWPHVLGIEGAGVIEAIGSEVHDLQTGDEVAAWEGSGAYKVSWGGAFQERVAVPAFFVAKKPKNISLEEAASLP
jgi:NADPH:quinone reductase-like Zn-dependent oxidoreductase